MTLNEALDQLVAFWIGYQSVGISILDFLAGLLLYTHLKPYLHSNLPGIKISTYSLVFFGASKRLYLGLLHSR